MEIYPLLDPYALKQDGSTPLTGNWNVGGYNITGIEALGAVDLTLSAPSNIYSLLHNSFSGLDGGQANQYYHLTQAEWGELTCWLDDVVLDDTDGGIDITAAGGSIIALNFQATNIVPLSSFVFIGGAGRKVLIGDSGGNPTIKTAVASNISLDIIADGTGKVTIEGVEFLGENVTSTGTIQGANLTATQTVQGEQLTSLDDITMQGHLLTMGDVGAATDTVLNFLGSTNTASITFDESADEFLFEARVVAPTGRFPSGIVTSGCVGFEDEDTGFLFPGSNIFNIQAGGLNFLQFSEKTGAMQDVCTFNVSGNDIDYLMESVNNAALFKMDAANDTISIGDGGVTNYTQFSTIGDILQAGTGRTLESLKYKLTAIGGYAVKLTNETGVNTVAGQVVKADTATNDAVILTAADEFESMGVFLDSGVADAAEAWVVVFGIADVAMEDDTTATRGNWVRTSITEPGYADATVATPPGGGVAEIDRHLHEIGHCIETVTATGGGTHILARCVIHFN